MVQAREVARKLEKAHPGLSCQIVGMTTTGDMALGTLTDAGGKGLFTKELEEGLFAGEIDIAVHSMKDVQTELPDGLIIPCMLAREDVRDVLICSQAKTITELPKGIKFGTSSLRRAAQLLYIRPDIEIVPLRGNVQTRLTKIERGDAGATMLAIAGLNRLGLTDIPAHIIPESECLPAVGQGAIGIECRHDDIATRELLAPLNCRDTHTAVMCERAFLRVLDGSCRTPIAGLARIENGKILFEGLLATPDGKSCRRIKGEGGLKEAEKIGREAGEKLRRL